MPIAAALLSPLTPTTSRGANDSAFPLSKQTPTPTPTHAKVTSLSHWDLFFSPANGVFRLPSLSGSSIEHLEIDIRFVNPPSPGTLPPKGKIHLPRVCTVTLRGGEFCLDDAQEEGRAAALREVMEALRPVEVNWLTSAEHSHALTFSTHLVHRSIVELGQLWSFAEHGGNLRRLTIQGGYPIPNLTAPTPQITPFTTPLPSPALDGGMSCYFSSLPSLPSTKPPGASAAAAAEEKHEKKRLAQYTLKPRFAYAFEAWHAESFRWSFEGNYTNPCILTAVSHLFKHLAASTSDAEASALPSAITLFPLRESILPALRDLPAALGLDEHTIDYLADTVFVSLASAPQTLMRVFEPVTVTASDVSSARRLKADMLVLSDTNGSVEISNLESHASSSSSSPESQTSMLTPGDVSRAASSPALSTSGLEADAEVDGADDGGMDRKLVHKLGHSVQGLQLS